MIDPFELNFNSAAKAESILHDAVQQTDRVFRPLGALCVSIMQNSMSCRDAAKGLIESEDLADNRRKEVYLFFEFIYFFMHCTLRTAFGRIDHSKLKLLQDFLLAMVPPSAIDSYFAHLPNDLKNDLIDEFVQRLDETEVEYGTCSPDGEASPILGLLIRNVIDVLGLAKADDGALPGILANVTRELEGMQLQNHIDKFGQNEMSEQDEMRMREWLNQFRLSNG